MMSDAVRQAPTGSFGAQLVVVPAVVAAIVVGVCVAIARAFSGCHDAEGDVDCVGGILSFVAFGIPAACVVTWAVLAWGTGAVRALVVTVAGAVVVAPALNLSASIASDDGKPPVWAAILIGGVSFGAVAFAGLPGLRRPVRVAVVAGLLAVVVAGLL